MTDTRTAAAPMPPGTYLTKRREAAGLSIDDVALLLGTDRGDVADIQNLLKLLELHNVGDVNALVDRLPTAFPLDVSIYQRLCALAFDPESGLPIPQVCRVCACSWHDACHDPVGRPCSWVAGDPTLCTLCVGKEPANDTGEAEDAA